MDRQTIEQRLQDLGADAPRLAPDDISRVIMSEAFHVFPGTTQTVCCLMLVNGYTVIGESAAVSAANFDAEIGREVARSNARDKIWALEGYALKERLLARAKRHAHAERIQAAVDDLEGMTE